MRAQDAGGRVDDHRLLQQRLGRLHEVIALGRGEQSLEPVGFGACAEPAAFGHGHRITIRGNLHHVHKFDLSSCPAICLRELAEPVIRRLPIRRAADAVGEEADIDMLGGRLP